MNLAKFADIKKQLNLQDDNIYLYTTEEDGTVRLQLVNEYELFAEEGLQEVYSDEPEGLWEQCLEGQATRHHFD